jgi:hypothetical protein
MTVRNKLVFVPDKPFQSSLMFVSESRGLYYKKLRIRNSRKMDRFRSKIVSFLLSVTFTGLDKHTSFDKCTSLLRNP